MTVLEYMVANGSERVIEEIREHAHQISVISILSIANIVEYFSFKLLIFLNDLKIRLQLVNIVNVHINRHCPIFNILIPVEETRETMSDGNHRISFFL